MSIINEEIHQETIVKNKLDLSYMTIPGLKLDGYKFIRNLVCSELEMSKEEVFTRSRKRKHVFARHLMMFLAQTHLKNEILIKIGDYYGGYDHATVLHAKQSIQDYMDTDKVLFKQISRLSEEVRITRKLFIQNKKESK